MARIRILVVDDSVVVRKTVSEALGKDPALEVVGTAGDGHTALSKIPLLKPDVVILDIAMPVMDGLETLKALRHDYPRLPVIMFSALTTLGAAETIEALWLGASDYATKPTASGNLALTIEAIQRDLIPKIKALQGLVSLAPLPLPRPARVRAHSNRRIDIVAIGTSTGGPNALAEVVPRLPVDFPVPVVIVQHMPALFTGLLAERLSRHSAISVAEGSQGTLLAPGHAWIAPGNFHMTVAAAHTDTAASGPHWRLGLNQDAPENSCRPSADVLFRSVSAVCGANVLGVVMTGMGLDGAIGAKHIREAGGEIIVQDEASSVVWGMPGAVCAAGQADAVYPLDRLAVEITRRVFHNRLARAVYASQNPVPMERSAK
jgi:two-component system chemotaxis response regulator CheB